MFRRNVTKWLENLKTMGEGRRAPETIRILERMDGEIHDLQKRIKRLEKK